MVKWILLFIAVPVAEVIIYIKLGKIIGLFPTLALIFGTGIVGVILARQQGFQIMNAVRTEIAVGRVPGNQLIDGFLILIGAVFLITPGLLTDLAGFFLLVPFTRVRVREFLKRKIRKWIREGKTSILMRYR
ncbi:MAG: FxsA family protein [Eubacteriales bacterium]